MLTAGRLLTPSLDALRLVNFVSSFLGRMFARPKSIRTYTVGRSNPTARSDPPRPPPGRPCPQVAERILALALQLPALSGPAKQAFISYSRTLSQVRWPGCKSLL